MRAKFGLPHRLVIFLSTKFIPDLVGTLITLMKSPVVVMYATEPLGSEMPPPVKTVVDVDLVWQFPVASQFALQDDVLSASRATEPKAMDSARPNKKLKAARARQPPRYSPFLDGCPVLLARLHAHKTSKRPAPLAMNFFTGVPRHVGVPFSPTST